MIDRSILARAAIATAVFTLLAAPARAADPAYPLGSHIGLVVPGTMKPSTGFRGFEDRDAGASLLIIEIPPQAYADVEKQISTAALKSQGMTEDKRETLALKSGNGLLVSGDQALDNKKARKWIFLSSTAEVGALIAVQGPDDAKDKYSDA